MQDKKNGKMLKGGLAAVVGAAMLAGGLGSFALWSDQAAVPGGEVNSGQLQLSVGAQSWKDISPDAVDTSWDNATDVIVPGDVIELDQKIGVLADGKNLNGELALDIAGLNLDAYEGYLDVDLAVDAPGFTPKAGEVNVFEFDADEITNGEVTTRVTFTFDPATPNKVAQNAAADLTEAVVTLKQVR